MLDLEYDPQPPFKGGNETNADKNMVEGMRALYDGGMDAALHPEKMFKNMKFDNAKDFVWWYAGKGRYCRHGKLQ